jgi:tetratricopeptide (TPR) repeat protein
MKRALVVLLAGLPLLAPLPTFRRAIPAARADEPAVKAWEAPLRIPTYPVGPPEPNPMFYAGREYQGARGPVYPYPLLDQLSDAREDRTYRALWLENEYVKLSVLPEIGGRIFSAEDKTNGYPFFYRQGVIKPALIGMLGAWISGGVEWNVFHHHRATTFMPVQSAITENPDGSRTIWVGETEWRQRMRWVVGITLRPGCSSVEATVRMVNRTPLAHSMLYFSNPAVHANPDYQVIFPPDVAWATFHAKNDFSPWPLARGPFVGRDYPPGTDLSWWKNHPYPISFFVYRSNLDFLGGYDHGRHAGVVHVADRDTMPGKKFWTWGNGPDGRMWDRILTDEDGPYIELMTGGYSDNQPDYSWIRPGEVRTVVHRWYPIRDLGGVKAANPEGAVNLDVKDQTVRIAVNTTAVRQAARVRLTAGDRIVSEESATIAPDAPFVREVALPAGVKETDLRLAVFSSSGGELVAYENRPRPQEPEPNRYAPPPQPRDVRTVEELYLAALRLEQFHNPYFDPEDYYREALRRDPGDARTNTALGILALRRGRWEDAKRHLSAAVARLTANHTRAKSGEAQYYLGLALVALGKGEAAREAFSASGWDLAFTAAAALEEARLESARGDAVRALALLDHALASNAQDTEAIALKAALLRRAGRTDEAFRLASAALAIDPLDPFAARERRLDRDAGAGGSVRDPALDAAETAALRTLEEDQPALELAHDYARAGLRAEAIAVLEARLPKARPDARADPLIAYTLGWLYEREGDAAAGAAAYRRGATLAPAYCFPFRLESIEVLEGAMAAAPKDAGAPHYLGNLLYDLQPERAIALWEKARALDPACARVHRNLAFAYARVRGDLARAVASQEKAVSIETREPRLYYELDQLLAWTRAPLATRLKWLQASPETVARREITRGRLARVQALMGRPDDALATLAEGRFHVWEGERGIHEVYVQARLQRGLARLGKGEAAAALEEFRATVPVPPNIEVGSGAGSHLAAVHHHVGLALEALGRRDEAAAAFRDSAASPAPLPDCHYWIGRSLEKLGHRAEARRHLERLAATPLHVIDNSRPLEPRMEMREAVANDHYLRALGLLGLARGTEARASLARALEADPDNVGAALLRHRLAATGPRTAPSPRAPARPQVEAPPRLPAEARPEAQR